MPQIAISSCTEMRSNPGYYLRSDAQKAWDRAVAAFGKVVLVTGAWRSYATQEKLFDGEKFPNQTPQYGRYSRGNRAGQRGYTNDVRWWPAKSSYWTRKEGTAAAAVPGTSNHGGGVAVDVKTRREAGDPPYAEAVVFGSWTDEDRTRFLRVAAEHGWDDDEGRSVNELWHLTYYAARDQHRGEAVPTPPKKEEFLMGLSDNAQAELAKKVGQIDTRTAQLITKAEREEKVQAERHAATFRRETETLAEITALSAGMKKLAENVDLDGDELVEAVKAEARAALKGLSFTVTSEGTSS